MNIYIGYDIGGTKCASIVANVQGDNVEFISRVEIPTEKRSPEIILDLLYKATLESLEKTSINLSDLKAIGVSCGGPLNSKDGIILCPPNLPGWVNIKVCEILRKQYNIPAYLQNDAKACAIAEWKWGAGRGTQNMIFCTMGTGFGAGLILNGKIYTGTNDMAGEVGHIRLAKDGPIGFGKAGSFEGFCSGGGIAQLAKMKAVKYLDNKIPTKLCENYEELGNITAKKVCDLAKSDDIHAKEIINIAAKKLGYGLSILVDIINPEVIVIGSVYARSRMLFEPIVNEILKEECISFSNEVCKVLPATLGDNIGDYAAIVVACEN